MSYASETAAISRKPCSLVTVTMDKCAEVFGVAPCTASLADNSPELVTNGNFETDTDWTKGTGWAIDTTNEKATCDGTQVADSDLETTGTPLTLAQVVEVAFTVADYSAGTITPLAGSGGTGTARSADGTYAEQLTVSGDTKLYLQADASFVGSVTIVSSRLVVAGTECYNTFETCRDRANYNKTSVDLKFTTFDSDVPFPGVRPYVKDIGVLPTKIDQELTVKSRLKITMLDEVSDDIFLDPYVATRTSNQGEFWKKLVARNPNYKGRTVKVSEGYIGEAEGNYQDRWQGQLENITINRGEVTLDSIDELVSLENTPLPDKINSTLVNNVTSSQLTIVLSTLLKDDGTQIDSSGYIRIDDEIIYYTSLTPASNQINIPADGRGYFGTTAASHDQTIRITLVHYFAPQGPFDHLRDIWDLAGGNYAADFDSSWTDFEDWPADDLNFSAIISEDDQVTAADLFWEIAKILDLHIWQDENQKISVRRNLGNDPDRTYTDLTDDANIIERSGSVDLNEKERKTRVIMYWGKSTLGDFDNVASYDEVDIAVDSDAESADGFNDVIQDIVFNRWISKRFLNAEAAENYVTSIVGRRLNNRRDARPIINISIELKDEGVLTGSSVRLNSDELLKPDGANVVETFIVMKREKIKGRLKLSLKEMPKRRICIITPASHPDYRDAENDELEYGFITDANGLMPNGDEGYYIW